MRIALGTIDVPDYSREALCEHQREGAFLPGCPACDAAYAALPDWEIVAVPNGEGDTITLGVVKGEEREAIDELLAICESSERTGSLDNSWEGGGPLTGGVVQTFTKSARIRLDTWERETENGWSQGYGWLRIRQVFR